MDYSNIKFVKSIKPMPLGNGVIPANKVLAFTFVKSCFGMVGEKEQLIKIDGINWKACDVMGNDILEPKDIIKLHEICGYLPYGLRILDRYDVDSRQYIDVNTIDYTYIMTTANISQTISRPFRFPVLRPLSDLTSEIEHGGKRFVPSTELRLFIQADIDYVISSPTSCDYDTVKKLYEWHFDIHGLIDRNLALNINDYEI